MTAQEIYELGVDYQSNGNYDQASKCYEQALNLGLMPDSTILFNMGISYLNTGVYDEARVCLNECVSQNPDAATYCDLGDAYYGINDYTQAIKCYEKAVGLNPDNPIKAMAYSNLGVIFSQVYKDNDKAIEYTKLAIKAKPNYVLYYCNLGHYYRSEGDYANSIKSYKAAIKLQPDFIKAYHDLEIVYRDNGQHKEANECYIRSVQIGTEKLNERINYFRRRNI
ncbi:MAG: tetratricopeptide repeat protein [Bacteroidales bacterium]|jgi:superkiller protein 3|nr:tetratricopeptide repeat protein [Bacteroidales bacterium]